MARVNSRYSDIPPGYLFSEISKRVRSFSEAHPGVELIRLGIGNTTEEIVPAVIRGLRRGVRKLAKRETYTGYGDEQGDARLREAIAHSYTERSVEIETSEVFVSDGAKSDCANITSIFADDSVVAITDPVYPVYRDSTILAGKKIVYMPAIEKNGFIPALPREHVDIIFLCNPNNPTGAVATKSQLQAFVDYALSHKAVIIFDAAYTEYIRDASLPKSIYEVAGAKECAIEIQSFSKSAGFTGLRLGWTVVPKALVVEGTVPGELHQTWNRRQTTMFNGASNVVQEGGLAALSKEGRAQTRKQVAAYMANADIIREGLQKAGFTVFGGKHAPYVWLKCPKGRTSWDFFDDMLHRAHIITTPGSGFGPMGEGYLRLSAFGNRETIKRAISAIQKNFTKHI